MFVGDSTVWKLQKAVRLSFVDFSTPEARRRFAVRELELNAAAETAGAAGVAFVGLWLDASLPELEARIAARPGDASVDVLREAAGASPGAGDWIALDARDAWVALPSARQAVRGRAGAC